MIPAPAKRIVLDTNVCLDLFVFKDPRWDGLLAALESGAVEAITRADCLAYTASRRKDGRTNSTIRTELESLRACLRWHYGSEAPSITAPSPSKPRERFLSKADRERLLDALKAEDVSDLFAYLKTLK